MSGAGEFRPVVEDPAEVTPAWMTTALRGGGEALSVSALAYEQIGTGQTGACYRFHLQGEGAGPRTVILKTAAGTLEQRARVRRGYRAEVYFYQALADTARIRTPRCWHAAMTDDAQAFTLVLEDASPATPGAQERGCSSGQAAEALRNLVGLHAPFWNSAILDEGPSWLATDAARAAMLAQIHATATDRFIARFEQQLDAAETNVLRRVAEVVPRWLLDPQGPRSLLHGDYRLDNLLFPTAADGPVMAVDWQTLDIGLPGRDLAYFIVTALDTEQRRASEAALVQTYHDQLRASGVRDYGLDACRDDYRRGMLQAPFITVIGCALATGERSESADRMFLSMARRAIHAIKDLEVLQLFSAGA
ncbi:phosphotransferase [Phenylobacterium sp. LjRoot219]|uniref:phosphotransferase family protein n=1 Tax=Phenylobacterium sp. LjRoot219 TaxID=3342283 RepID=UPI003ECC3021